MWLWNSSGFGDRSWNTLMNNHMHSQQQQGPILRKIFHFQKPFSHLDSPRHMHIEWALCLVKIYHYTDCHYPIAAGSSGLEMNHPFIIILLLCLIVLNKLSLLSARPRKQICTAGYVAAWSVRSETTSGPTSAAVACPGF